jgi:hypothetical protein
MEQGRKSASVAAALAAARRKGAAISFPADTVLLLRSLLKACISRIPAIGCKHLHTSSPECFARHHECGAVEHSVAASCSAAAAGLRRML